MGRRHVSLAHTRLAIIDLDPRANQPFESDGCVLIFNGEIYNYRELRSELVALGSNFKTQSDTEVIIKAWLAWGVGCLDRLEGMWAFALVDTCSAKVLLSRDRFGEKPLYVWKDGSQLHFASEIKALSALAGRWPEVDTSQVRRFLVNGYKSLYKRSATFYADVSEFPAASFQLIDAGGEVGTSSGPERYWSLTYAPRAMQEREAVEGVRERLRRSLELRLRADVPIAFCLSGGIDSGTLVSMGRKLLGQDVHAFSIIDSDERYREAENIEATVREVGCRLHVVRTDRRGFLERLAAQSLGRDAPVATISYYLHDFLSEAIAKAGYRVAVSGTAADELFTGYYDHYGFWLAEMSYRADLDHLVNDWRQSLGAWVQNPVLKQPLVFKDQPMRRDHIYLNREVFSSYLVEPCDEPFEETQFSDNVLRSRMMNELFCEAVPVILKEDDLNSMRWSVENRSPYLDRELVEFAYSIPNELLIKDGYTKWPLRAAAEGLLVDQTRLDKRKRGFNASIDSLLDRNDPDTIDRMLAPSPIFDIVRRDMVEGLITSDLNDNSFSKFAFSFISAKLFLESAAAGLDASLAA